MLKKLGPKQLHIALDLWTSKSNKSVLGIKAYFIDKDWNLKCKILGFKHFTYSKTGHNLRQFIKAELTSLGITPKMVTNFH